MPKRVHSDIPSLDEVEDSVRSKVKAEIDSYTNRVYVKHHRAVRKLSAEMEQLRRERDAFKEETQALRTRISELESSSVSISSSYRAEIMEVFRKGYHLFKCMSKHDDDTVTVDMDDIDEGREQGQFHEQEQGPGARAAEPMQEQGGSVQMARNELQCDSLSPLFNGGLEEGQECGYISSFPWDGLDGVFFEPSCGGGSQCLGSRDRTSRLIYC